LRAVSDQSVDALRAQLRDRGYLSHGIERWFALDPWRSRTFWAELLIVALKAAALVSAFGAVATTAVVLLRNHPLTPVETLELFIIYAAGWAAATFALVVAVGLLIKIRPAFTIETPRALLGIGIAAAGLLAAMLALWWYGFPGAADAAEIAVVVASSAVLFVVATIVISAALLSFSIHELQRIPTIHQKPRTVPMAVAAAVLVAILLAVGYATPRAEASAPTQVVVSPTSARLVLVAVDGLTEEIIRSRPDIARQFTTITPVPNVPARSASERWATVGTGVPTALHRVQAIAGVRLAGGRHVLQSVSRWDYLLLRLAPAFGVATPLPLPPTVRRRDFVWETLAERSIPIVAVNWWTAEKSDSAAYLSVTQDTIFSSDPLRVDETASRHLVDAVAKVSPRFATVYLPALDVVLNRLKRDELASSLRALNRVAETISRMRLAGYDVLVVGAPGEGQSGQAVVAATFATKAPSSLMDVAPTILETMGFPASNEMPGRSLAGTASQQRVASYGTRARRESDARLSQEYYESLKSLGYIR
jgi:hypothetical protein